jgi:hypothetical protein
MSFSAYDNEKMLLSEVCSDDSCTIIKAVGTIPTVPLIE